MMERKWINKELLTLDIPMDILRSMRDPKDPRDPGERSSHAIQMHSQPSYPDYYRGSESMPNPQHPHLQRQLPPNKQGGHGRTYTESSQEYSKYYSTGSHPNQSFVNTRMMRELLLEQGLGNKSCDARLTGGDQDLFDELDNVVTSLSVIEDGKLTESNYIYIYNIYIYIYSATTIHPQRVHVRRVHVFPTGIIRIRIPMYIPNSRKHSSKEANGNTSNSFKPRKSRRGNVLSRNNTN